MRKDQVWVFRMVHFMNLPYILENGIHCRNSEHANPHYVNIGSSDIIGRRDSVVVKCYPETFVNDYVPFYFGVRTPMLYKIVTGYGVARVPQEEIVYLCCEFVELTESDLQWCFTDGNAATRITNFYTDADDYALLDWKSIYAIDWTDDNSDGDHDRMRKKHSEFLVRGHVPVGFIKRIIVLTEEKKQVVNELIDQVGLKIDIYIGKKDKFYF